MIAKTTEELQKIKDEVTELLLERGFQQFGSSGKTFHKKGNENKAFFVFNCPLPCRKIVLYTHEKETIESDFTYKDVFKISFREDPIWDVQEFIFNLEKHGL